MKDINGGGVGVSKEALYVYYGMAFVKSRYTVLNESDRY